MSDAGDDYDALEDEIYEVEDDDLDEFDEDEDEEAEDEDFGFESLVASNADEARAQFNARNLRMSKLRSGAEARRVPKHQRRTRPVMDRHEFAKCIALRTQQIANGHDAMITVPSGMTESKDIAHLEITKKKTPFIIVRIIPHAKLGDVAEWWDLDEMDNPHTVDFG